MNRNTKTKQPLVIDLLPVRNEKLSAKEYLRLLAEHPALIDRADFIPPQPGASGFGSFDVRYTRARFRSFAHG
jgi:hypothetical protein